MGKGTEELAALSQPLSCGEPVTDFHLQKFGLGALSAETYGETNDFALVSASGTFDPPEKRLEAAGKRDPLYLS
jgi:hypothetical protein